MKAKTKKLAILSSMGILLGSVLTGAIHYKVYAQSDNSTCVRYCEYENVSGCRLTYPDGSVYTCWFMKPRPSDT